MRILYFETTAYYPSSPLFLEALEQLSRRDTLEHVFVDEAEFLDRESSLIHRIAHRLLGTRPPGCRALNRGLIDQAQGFRPDAILICKGANIAPKTLASIKDETGA